VKDADCVALLQWALPRLEMRWPGFRKVRGQVCKRIGRRMRELGLETGDSYRRFLESHPSEWAVLDDCCRVTISRFFRDAMVWQHLGDHVLPELAGACSPSGAPLRAWSIGCASGEEPYTAAIVWSLGVGKRFPGVTFDVLATDADPAMLARARKACYAPSSLRDVPAGWLEAAFETRDHEHCLRPGFKRMVTLTEGDVRGDLPTGPFHVVFCRNLVFTYFEGELQSRILSKLLDRLVHGGRLVLGSHETLPPGPWPLEPEGTGIPVFRKLAKGQVGAGRDEAHNGAKK